MDEHNGTKTDFFSNQHQKSGPCFSTFCIDNCERSELSGLFNGTDFLYIYIYIYVYFRPYVVP